MSYSVNNQVANQVLRAKDSRHTQQVRKLVLIERPSDPTVHRGQPIGQKANEKQSQTR